MMVAWLRSRRGGLVLSFAALLSLLVRSYADTRYILVEDFQQLGMGFALLWFLTFTAMVGGWVWALVRAAEGSRRAVMVLLVYALVTALGFGLASLVAFLSMLPEVFIFGASLLTGGLASVALILQWRDSAPA